MSYSPGATDKQSTAPNDPYTLRAEDIKEPPKGWVGSLKYLGPGIITSASIVGSGELIATTALGAQAGFVLLWMVVLSTTVKVAVQVELARWTITTGEPGLTGFNRVPPRFGRTGWISFLWLLMALSKIVQMGGIVGGTAAAMSIMIPIGSDPLSPLSLGVWTAIIVIGSIAMLWSNRYGLIERIATVLIVTFSIATIGLALSLPFTPFPYGLSDVAGGLTFHLPLGMIGIAVAMFGLTGVGADEIAFYTYWCVEKGYARYTGPNDGSQEWVDRANGWIGVMQKDAFISWIIYTLGTIAFYIMGAAVLHPQGLIPEGNEMITTLSQMYTDAIGSWAGVIFLICAVAVLGSTLWAAIPSHARMWTNFLANTGVLDWKDPSARNRWLRFFTVLLPVLWGILFLVVSSPVVMITIGGIATGIFLLAVVIGTWYLRRTETDDRVKGGRGFAVFLVISSVAIGLVGVYTALNALGVELG
ncbi:Nramp family divalent metal transporter [Brevibacterium sp.]|uniref:Nramp family divalent metal transporter n=1 Tax=Brevibacterium sp. TaxID=1701 RepID=UPI002811BD6D|nr:Nramp family divalent metal transporter [Brevibacterium sp.]